MDLGLREKVVMVVGASRGIGRSVALSAAGEGAHLAIGARSAEDLNETVDAIKACGSRVVSAAGDMAERAEVDRLVAAATDQLGGVDAVVTCVGSTPLGRFDSIGVDVWQLAFATKFLPTVHAVRAATPALRARGGAVVAVAGNSSHAPDPLLTTSVVMNSALVGLVGALARELAPAGISVNAVSPGPVDTERLQGLIAARADAGGLSNDEARASIERAIPSGQIAQPADVAPVVVALLSPLWRHLTGENVVVDGAQSWAC